MKSVCYECRFYEEEEIEKGYTVHGCGQGSKNFETEDGCYYYEFRNPEPPYDDNEEDRNPDIGHVGYTPEQMGYDK